MSVYDKPIVASPLAGQEEPARPMQPAEASPSATGLSVSPAQERFRSCRWRKAAENGVPECCGHRDVLPLTGANGFDADAWCPECSFYKLRRTPKKREYYDRY